MKVEKIQHDLALVMPVAGRGSRFTKLGIREPKPLIELNGKPFFWWAAESVRRVVKLRQMVFVVLEEHIADFSIDQRIKDFYPDATIVAIPEITSGAAETGKIGLDALKSPGPVAINDCDHAFLCQSIPSTVAVLQGGIEGALMCFRSADPAYSYVKLNDKQQIIGTVEKQVASPFAIAGCYFFSDAVRYFELYERYKQECAYNELFVSGLFNLIAQKKQSIGMLELDRHISFGTPEEKSRLTSELFAPFASWK